MDIKNMLNKAVNIFKDLIKKAQQPPTHELRLRDQKAILTKALNRYVKNSNSPLKLSGVLSANFPGYEVTYSIILVPGSTTAVSSFMSGEDVGHEHLSFPWLSNYIVTHDGFDRFLEQIPKVTIERKENHEPNISDSI